MGNGAKAALRKEKQAAAGGKSQGSQLKANAAALNIQCAICKQTFLQTTKAPALTEHAVNKHKGGTLESCFPGFKA
ncbi:hypothetical protein OIV83_002837 [Microbotryomycetes sp. JL201]|nr:hypothetical protein OIV83_002837 [Microbotryomycetes sp. JL201]